MTYLDGFIFALETITAAVSEAQEQLTNTVAECQDSYDLAGVALTLTGANQYTAYQALPKMNPRTIRRITSKVSVRMCMCTDVTEEDVHKDSKENAVLDAIQETAAKAKVKVSLAVTAVTRYLNSPNRVKKVLEDLAALQTQAKVYNPNGLFTRLMRTGEDVKLPQQITAKHEEQQKQKAKEEQKQSVSVGMLAIYYGEVCPIVRLTNQFAYVLSKDGEYSVSRDSLRLAPTA